MGEVIADPARIRLIGKMLLDLSVEIDKHTPLVKNAIIKPGSANPFASELKIRYDQRVNVDGSSALEALTNVLFNAGTELVKLAGVYDSAEDLNADDIVRLQDVISGVQKIFPSFNPFPKPVEQL